MILCDTCQSENAVGATVCSACASPLGATRAGSYLLPAGTRLQGGSFAVGKPLGQGGFGVTYQGSDLRLQRPVAIKEFFPQGSMRQRTTVQPGGGTTPAEYSEQKSRFLDEARTLARFHHPAVVHVHASFEENNTAYMVMEFVKGRPLSALLEREPLPEKSALAYAVAIGEALEVVHAAGLLHRDIKPDNVMVTDDARVVLIDFGSARGFAAGRTHRMTRMVTPGYAPLEQYSQQGRFGAPTDVYALGATLYHMLTGEVPASPMDVLQGVRLVPPFTRNPRVTRTVSDAVMWALETKIGRRPQSMREFIGALQGATARPASSPRSQTKTSAGTAATAPANPYEARIQHVLKEISAAPPPLPPSRHDGRIAELGRLLVPLAQPVRGTQDQCPACRGASLVRLTGQPDGRCPLCRAVGLVERRWDPAQCPVCRAPALVEHQIPGDLCFCPVCRRGRLQKERRRQMAFGPPMDLWWVCPECGAEFDVFTGGRAKLVRVREDPLGMGRLCGQTLPIENWRRLAGRSDRYCACANCSAELDAADADRWTLIHYSNDPYGVGALHQGHTLFRSAWARLAQGLPLSAGNTGCTACQAEFDYTQAEQLLAIKNCPDLPAWAQQWLGKPLPITTWYLAGSGKRSLQPGFVCHGCGAEFDDAQGGLRLHVATGPLATHVSRVLSLDDWHRIGRGCPTGLQEKQLRAELEQLTRARQQEHASLLQGHQQQRSRLETELRELVKRALLDGHGDLRLQSRRIRLRSSEVARWETWVERLKQRSSQGHLYWDRDQQGWLVVTNERVLFETSSAATPWQRGVGKIERVENPYIRGISLPVVVLWFEDLQKPVGFVIPDSMFKFTLQGRTHEVALAGRDLLGLLNSVRPAA
jgi:serine/threonine protein kinase